MGRLKILADGNSPQAQSQRRGKLFEKLMSEVLRHYGYKIDDIPSVNYAGMEIDIEGRTLLANTPLYAECKCFDTDVTSPDLQKFFGKYTTRWFKDKRCQGLFVAIPGVNSHAKGFYRENCESNAEITIQLIEEQQVLDTMYESQLVARPEVFQNAIDPDLGSPGDSLILYTDKGCFGVQYIIPQGTGVANSIVLFDALGHPITENETIDYLIQMWPELGEFHLLQVKDSPIIGEFSGPSNTEQIVEVRGSSSCFEYQFPASPEYFVGREVVLKELDSFVSEVTDKTTSSRGIVFEANSGWGKSSVVLASVDRLRKDGHAAVAIDSRTASTSQFILQAVDYTLKNVDSVSDLAQSSLSYNVITGFNGMVDALVDVGRNLENRGKVLFVFLDQFENMFSLNDALARIRDLFVKVVDAQTNVVFGFLVENRLSRANKRISLSDPRHNNGC